MSVKVKNGVFQVEKLEIENSVVVEYLTGLPDREREAAVVRAIGIGVLAEIKGEIAQFLNETEGELGQRLASLKALYELRELRFRETSGKGEQAERQVLQALTDIQTSLGFEQDEIVDLSKQRGQLPRNKTGDLMIAVDGSDHSSIGIEVKLDKGVRLGLIEERDPSAQTDTVIGQLLEMRANRETDANVIVFDQDSVDSTVAAACRAGIKFFNGVGFVVIVSTRAADYANLSIVYAICREMAKAGVHQSSAGGRDLTMIIERLIYLVRDYRSVEKEVDAIKKSADKISKNLEKLGHYVGVTQKALKQYLENGNFTEEERHLLYQGESIEGNET